MIVEFRTTDHIRVTLTERTLGCTQGELLAAIQGCGCFGCHVIRHAFLDRIRRLKEDEPLGSC
jgi:hypothetical protein